MAKIKEIQLSNYDKDGDFFKVKRNMEKNNF
jgi:hypothetical protein